MEFKPHDYQKYAIEYVKKTPRCGLFLDMGLGKSLDDELVCPTPTGPKKVKDIQLGDQLFGKDGKPTTVIGVYKHKNKKAYKVTLKDGRSFICCDEHLIPFQSYTGAKLIQVKPLKEMLDDYKTYYNKEHPTWAKYKYRIPICDAVEYPEQEHIIHPYVMGVLIGDGCLKDTSLTVSSNDPDIVYKIAELQEINYNNIHKNKYSYSWSYTNDSNATEVRKELKRLGLRGCGSHDKFIPDEYIYDSIENRIQLLTGLIDSDGSIAVSHKQEKNANHNTSYTYHSINENLIKQVQQISWSLGFVGGYSKRYENDGKTLHNIYLRIITPLRLDLCKRKKAMDTGVRNPLTPGQLTIVDIAEVEPRDMTCFTVDSDDHLFLTKDYIVTHNTAVTLHALKELGNEGLLPGGHILVCAPRNIARNSWPAELLKWDGFENLNAISLIEKPNGVKLTKQKREELFDKIPTEVPSIYFINRELLVSLIDYTFKHFNGKWYFPVVVIDELQSFKSYSSKRFKAIKRILPQVERLIGLTGTPAPNNLQDLYPEIFLLDEGQRLGRTITEFRSRWFYPGRVTPQGYPYEWFPKPGAEEDIYNSISDITVSMKNTLKLPDLTFNNIVWSLDDKDRKLYNKFKREKIIELDPDIEIQADNAAVLAAKLTMLAGGAIYNESGSHEYTEVHQLKLDMLERILDQAQGSPILCFYWFKADKERLMKRFPFAVPFNGEKDKLKAWNNGEYQLMIANPASCGHGLNMQEGPGHTIVFFTLPWSLELYSQAIKRVHRQGQTKPVIVHRLITKGTIDERILKVLDEKDTRQQALLDAVKAEFEDEGYE